MSAFLPKPFGRSEVQELLGRFLAGRLRPLPEPVPRAEGGPVGVFDRERALGACPGSQEVLQKLLEVFLERLASPLAAIRRAAGEGDAEGLHREAHAIKGAALNLHAAELAGLASRLESEAKAGGIEPAARLVPLLEQAAGRFREAAAGRRKEGSC
jgi:HPt (histidine-containing phosphotransfer) domain-containing protein